MPWTIEYLDGPPPGERRLLGERSIFMRDGRGAIYECLGIQSRIVGERWTLDVVVDEVSVVDRPANPHARIAMFKRNGR